MCYKENESLLFDFIENGQIFPSKVCHFQYDHRFFFSIEMGNIRICKEYVWKNLGNLNCQDSIRFGVFLAYF